MSDAVALGIAIYGAVVSTISISVAVRALRNAEPHVKVRAVIFPTDSDRSFAVSVENTGRADITIQRVHLFVRLMVPDERAFMGMRPRLQPVDVEWNEQPDSDRLPGKDYQTWNAPRLFLDQAVGHRFDDGDRAVVWVSFPGGLVTAKVEVPWVGEYPRWVTLLAETISRRTRPARARIARASVSAYAKLPPRLRRLTPDDWGVVGGGVFYLAVAVFLLIKISSGWSAWWWIGAVFGLTAGAIALIHGLRRHDNARPRG
jgi:hypothetical protein